MKKSMGLWCIIISVVFLPALAMHRSHGAKRPPQFIYVCPRCSYCTDCKFNIIAHSCEEARQAIVCARETYRRCVLHAQPKADAHTGHCLRK